jgi:hypothetical protein
LLAAALCLSGQTHAATAREVCEDISLWQARRIWHPLAHYLFRIIDSIGRVCVGLNPKGPGKICASDGQIVAYYRTNVCELYEINLIKDVSPRKKKACNTSRRPEHNSDMSSLKVASLPI